MLKLLAVELKGKAAGHPVMLGGHGHFPGEGGVGVARRVAGGETPARPARERPGGPPTKRRAFLARRVSSVANPRLTSRIRTPEGQGRGQGWAF